MREPVAASGATAALVGALLAALGVEQDLAVVIQAAAIAALSAWARQRVSPVGEPPTRRKRG